MRREEGKGKKDSFDSTCPLRMKPASLQAELALD